MVVGRQRKKEAFHASHSALWASISLPFPLPSTILHTPPCIMCSVLNNYSDGIVGRSYNIIKNQLCTRIIFKGSKHLCLSRPTNLVPWIYTFHTAHWRVSLEPYLVHCTHTKMRGWCAMVYISACSCKCLKVLTTAKKSCSQNGYRKPRPHVSVAARLRGMALPASVVVRDVMSERNPPNIKQNMGDMLVEWFRSMINYTHVMYLHTISHMTIQHGYNVIS